MWRDWFSGEFSSLVRPIGVVERVLAMVAVLGSGVFTATLLFGRTALFWPSLAWALTAAGTSLVAMLCWRAARTTWPSLLLLPAAAAALATYADEPSNHLLAVNTPSRDSLLVYGIGLWLLGQAAFWLARLARSRSGFETTRDTVSRTDGAASAPPVALAIAAAAYANSSLFLQWVPTQTDLLVNLNGARRMLAGGLPYNDDMPVWADRVHMLPVTLLTLFSPLSWLEDGVARLIFFVANQALWLLALVLLVRRLVPAGQRALWIAGLVLFSAVYWPWQEAIRFGQQDGLLVLLFVLSITAASRGRPVESGLALGVAMIVKPLSIWLPLIYVIHGRWRILFVAGATALALVFASLPFTGIEPWRHFVAVEVPQMLPGTVRGTNIPLPSLHARLFVGRERLGDGDAAPQLGVISALTAATNVLGLLLVARLATRRPPAQSVSAFASRERTWLLDASIGLTLTLLLAPMAWQHYASWLTIAFAVLALPAIWRPLDTRSRAGAALLSGCAFFLLSLEDARLLRLTSDLVERWPAIFSFYAVGLICLLGALAIARFTACLPVAVRSQSDGFATQTSVA